MNLLMKFCIENPVKSALAIVGVAGAVTYLLSKGTEPKNAFQLLAEEGVLNPTKAKEPEPTSTADESVKTETSTEGVNPEEKQEPSSDDGTDEGGETETGSETPAEGSGDGTQSEVSEDKKEGSDNTQSVGSKRNGTEAVEKPHVKSFNPWELGRSERKITAESFYSSLNGDNIDANDVSLGIPFPDTTSRKDARRERRAREEAIKARQAELDDLYMGSEQFSTKGQPVFEFEI